ncbi:MAG TPA: hypothetical protein H9890_03360 [Candidatus Faecalibacterium intestinigallinarum]|uniref:Uncharacterized protein n=1 Tax=Candidatus Faecalibacterium intestinigallinarum TaxID=2838581 RepID=A0A9D1Q7W2_9FIRM|nr:hypothetical protein [Candidatus Faecalibacterium intestinigallinarum]
MWIYRSPIGPFVIRRARDGYYELWHGSECYGRYINPVAAADDVYLQHTGCDQWDDLNISNAPTDLGEWERT